MIHDSGPPRWCKLIRKNFVFAGLRGATSEISQIFGNKFLTGRTDRVRGTLDFTGLSFNRTDHRGCGCNPTFLREVVTTTEK